MIKSSIIALLTVAAIGGIAAPAFADTGSDSAYEDSTQQSDFSADAVLFRLQQSGVPATSVEEWGGLVRAYIVQPDGTQAMQFFAPHTLKPVTL